MKVSFDNFLNAKILIVKEQWIIKVVNVNNEVDILIKMFENIECKTI